MTTENKAMEAAKEIYYEIVNGSDPTIDELARLIRKRFPEAKGRCVWVWQTDDGSLGGVSAHSQPCDKDTNTASTLMGPGHWVRFVEANHIPDPGEMVPPYAQPTEHGVRWDASSAARQATPPVKPGAFGEPWTNADSGVYDASGEYIGNSHKHVDRAVACVNALSGMEPSAVAGLVEAVKEAQRYFTSYVEPTVIQKSASQSLRDALAKLGAK